MGGADYCVLLEATRRFRSIWDSRLEFLNTMPKAMISTIPEQSSCGVVYSAHNRVFCSVFLQHMFTYWKWFWSSWSKPLQFWVLTTDTEKRARSNFKPTRCAIVGRQQGGAMQPDAICATVNTPELWNDFPITAHSEVILYAQFANANIF